MSAKLFLCFSGIMAFFLVYGVVQERLMTTQYDPEDPKSRFRDTAFLVLINRVVSIGFALVSSFLAFRSRSSSVDTSFMQDLEIKAPWHSYALVALSNFTATYCQYEALKYVSFPTQTLGKCAKMIPVLLIGSLLQKKQYSLKEYLVALAVTVGCFMFLNGGSVTAAGKGSNGDTPFGLLLIMLYLGADGLTSTSQERLFKQYSTSTQNQMLYVNLCSAFISLLVLTLPSLFASDIASSSSNRLWEALDFAVKYPQMLSDALVLSLCSSMGQLIIYYTIKEFGALIYSTIMTTRQFFSVLLSALLFAHVLTVMQWLGALTVFAALWVKALVSDPSKNKKKKSVLAISTDDLKHQSVYFQLGMKY